MRGDVVEHVQVVDRVRLELVAVGGELHQLVDLLRALLVPARHEEREPRVVRLQDRPQRVPVIDRVVVDRERERTAVGGRDLVVRDDRQVVVLREGEHALDRRDLQHLAGDVAVDQDRVRRGCELLVETEPRRIAAREVERLAAEILRIVAGHRGAAGEHEAGCDESHAASIP